jgi:hypothetical protein
VQRNARGSANGSSETGSRPLAGLKPELRPRRCRKGANGRDDCRSEPRQRPGLVTTDGAPRDEHNDDQTDERKHQDRKSRRGWRAVPNCGRSPSERSCAYGGRFARARQRHVQLVGLVLRTKACLPRLGFERVRLPKLGWNTVAAARLRVTRRRLCKLEHEDERRASESDHDAQPVRCRTGPHLSES